MLDHLIIFRLYIFDTSSVDPKLVQGSHMARDAVGVKANLKLQVLQ